MMMINHSRTILSLAVSAISLASIAPVVAQTMLEEVVVTSQKRAQPLNDVGIAVSAFSGEQMKDLGIVTAGDLAKHTPGLYLTDAGASGIPVYTIRGIGFDDISPNSNGTVGLYLDEVAYAYPVMTRGIQYDMERIEVLKGPQGDLYGRNNTGGAINFISNKPTDSFEAGVTAEYGRYDHQRLTAFASGPLSDNVRVRAVIDSTRQDGWQDNAVTGDELGEIDSLGYRFLLDWSITENLDAMFKVHGSKDESENPVPQSFLASPSTDASAYPYYYDDPWAFAKGGEPRVVQDLDDNNAALWNPGRTPGRDNTTIGASLTLTWDTEHFTLTSITAGDSFEREETGDWDGVLDDRSFNFMETDIDGWSQELRFTSNSSGALTWIGGVYIASDEVDDSLKFLFSDASNSAGANESLTLYKQETDIAAVYGHAEYQFADQWRLIGGVRYTEEEREIDICTRDSDGSLAAVYNSFGLTDTNGGAFSPGDCVSLGDFNGVGFDNEIVSDSIDVEKVTGKIGLDWLPNDDWLVYASVSSGFKSGGFNGQTSAGKSTYLPYDEEELLAYEVGFKATLLDGSMQLNGSAFFYDYSDKQVTDATPDPVFGFLTKIKNVPESEVTGLELEMMWRPMDGLDVKLSGTWLDTEVKEFASGFNFETFEENLDFSGQELPNSAEAQYNALVAYKWSVTEGINLRVQADYMYTDSYFSYLSNNPTDTVDSYHLVNTRVALQSVDGAWEVAAWGKNITDEYYYVSNTLGNDVFSRYAGMGATYGLSVSYNWF
jgi:iron complex outermembrane receptor protein